MHWIQAYKGIGTLMDANNVYESIKKNREGGYSFGSK